MTNILKAKTVFYQADPTFTGETTATGTIIADTITIQSLHASRSRKDGPY
ncbi:hypothetical protein HF324_09690 [Chitinophaga oryzae]|uniref:Uncharacterized protein n=1 Tax=Chitinophaga oryzae TaxID=2725414 RepID=A0AAE6ZET2_9BACT|nr:hypothetical protein [Chitinophaga oryzae]QJB31630.1 hypothetical protein HF329_10030 [Chitinophaga oryzae]QJB38114.1 hypothetical protein HF324_09690 [Chitinophaga oryzae]